MNALGGTSITIGDKALFSNNIEIHTTDYHKMYDEHGNITTIIRIFPQNFILSTRNYPLLVHWTKSYNSLSSFLIS